ncbi:hypothetical protein EDB83DRAFT_2339512, partial [Lactarius deliciosus]
MHSSISCVAVFPTILTHQLQAQDLGVYLKSRYGYRGLRYRLYHVTVLADRIHAPNCLFRRAALPPSVAHASPLLSLGFTQRTLFRYTQCCVWHCNILSALPPPLPFLS